MLRTCCRPASGCRSSAASRRSVRSRLSVLASSAPQKRILITGGNDGMGFCAARALLKQRCEVTLACKDDAKSELAKRRLLSEVPGAVVNTEHIDLGDLSSVRECADRLLDQAPFDVVLNNAGVVSKPRCTTKDGFELHFGINYLGHYALTSLLLPLLLESNKSVRIVNVASAVHLISKIQFDDLQRERWYGPWEAYGQSKVAKVMWTYELARRLQDTNVTVNALHPGTVKTHLGKTFASVALGDVLGGLWADMFFSTPEQGARTHVYLASSPEVEGVTGKYWADNKPHRSSRFSHRADVAKKLLEVSEQLTGIPSVPAKVPQYEKARTT